MELNPQSTYELLSIAFLGSMASSVYFHVSDATIEF